MRRTSNIDELTPFAKWFTIAIDYKGTNLKRVAEAIDADYTYLWKVMNAHKPLYKQYKRPGYEVTRDLGKFLGDVDGALKAADFYEQPENHADMTTDRAEIEYAVDPELRTLIETYEDADDDGKAVIWHGVEQAKRIKSALSASRSGAFGERKDD